MEHSAAAGNGSATEELAACGRRRFADARTAVAGLLAAASAAGGVSAA